MFPHQLCLCRCPEYFMCQSSLHSYAWASCCIASWKTRARPGCAVTIFVLFLCDQRTTWEQAILWNVIVPPIHSPLQFVHVITSFKPVQQFPLMHIGSHFLKCPACSQWSPWSSKFNEVSRWIEADCPAEVLTLFPLAIIPSLSHCCPASES